METKAAPIDQFFNDVVSTGLIATLTCHTYRAYLAVSPDGQTIVTGAGDETLRSWFSGFDMTASGSHRPARYGAGGFNPLGLLQVPGSRFRNSYYLYRDDDT
ncbi:hypothetical protein IGI04_015314 [Brassica rapa subsp. trilocularis]|uniref:Uncharacterized protein n=2 Tax=Brassica campestris TaxID=3711 RepID=M4FFD0_BRACM|nr:hypothetical protein IGI04_015314 [Brassica rapa subsp. trilocularis]